MARTTSYGLGQYRIKSGYDYISRLGYYNVPQENGNENTNGMLLDCGYYKNNDYQDIKIKMPIDETNTSVVQMNRTFFVRLTIPQNRQYELTLNLKLCPTGGNEPDTNRFQHIKQLIVPPTPQNDNDNSTVILYQVPNSNSDVEVIRACVLDEEHEASDGPLDRENEIKFKNHITNDVYYEKRKQKESNSTLPALWGYYYYDTINGEEDYFKVTNFCKKVLDHEWKTAYSADEGTITFEFIFSPKYNLTSGYDWLLIETDRSSVAQKNIQYVDDKDTSYGTYYGTRIDTKNLKFEIYSVNNLLQANTTGQSEILSQGTLSHISVWGHPEQLLAINGEEIKIGQSGYYELNDFTINTLGVVVQDFNKDRFIIDYEYKIIN